MPEGQVRQGPGLPAYLRPVSDDGTWLVVGLGNPGPKYAGNRHNVGAMVVDELDIPAGDVRLKKGGGEGGHNGLRSITSAVGTRDYLRVRVGIGRPPGRMDPADFVLRDFGTTERGELPFLLGDAADAAEMVVVEGLVAAQQKYHSPA